MLDDSRLRFWDFHAAPRGLRNTVPEAYQGGWVALISGERKDEIATLLLDYLRDSSLSYGSWKMPEGEIVVAGRE